LSPVIGLRIVLTGHILNARHAYKSTSLLSKPEQPHDFKELFPIIGSGKDNTI